ncbi:MAG: aldo/keto reductase [Chthoniobacterales bacterium]
MAEQTNYERREFLRKLGLVTAGLAVGGAGSRRLFAEQEGKVVVPKRKFGKHDLEVSSLALGGHALRVASDKEAAKLVDAALEMGVNFFDNAWDYHKGESEKLMGRLIEGRRDQVFLMTKVCTHDSADYDTAMRMLDESLERLKTDHLDLWQWHAVATQEQVKLGFEKGGVVEALTEAKRDGRVRYVGFTGHTNPDVHLAVLSEGYEFDACQLPISPIEANSNAFVRRVLPELIKQNIAPLAMKTLGGNYAPVEKDVFSLNEGLDYALSHPIATLVTGTETAAQLRANARIAMNFSAMDPAKMVALEDRAKPAAESQNFEPYRRWMSYRDGDAHLYKGLA